MLHPKAIRPKIKGLGIESCGFTLRYLLWAKFIAKYQLFLAIYTCILSTNGVMSMLLTCPGRRSFLHLGRTASTQQSMCMRWNHCQYQRFYPSINGKTTFNQMITG